MQMATDDILTTLSTNGVPISTIRRRWALCPVKIMALKSVSLQKMEAMEQSLTNTEKHKSQSRVPRPGTSHDRQRNCD